MLRSTFAVATAIALLAAAPQEPKKVEDAKAMEGTWEVKVFELGGEQLPEEFAKTIELTLADGKYAVKSSEFEDKGTVKVDASKTPKEMDVKGEDGPNAGKSIPAIYELDGDTLKVCYDLSGKKRPSEFKTTPGTTLMFAVYQRKK